MRRIFELPCYVCMFAFVASCGTAPQNTFTITGEYIVVSPSPAFTAARQEAVSAAADSAEDESDALANARVVVTHETTNPQGEVERIELAAGNFADGKITLTGEIDAPTLMEISVEVDGFPPFPIKSVVAPKGNLEFVLVSQNAQVGVGRLMTVGSSNHVLDPSRKFTISGDFSDLEQDLSNSTASVVSIGQYRDGEMAVENFGTVLPQDGKFVFEAEISEPTVVRVIMQASSGYYAMTSVIVEPDAEITIRPYGGSANLLRASGTGTHHEVIGSWESSSAYQEVVDAFVEKFAEYQSQQELSAAEAARLAAAGSDSDAGGENLPEVERRPVEYSLAEGCEHLKPENVIQPLMVVNVEYPSYWEAYQAQSEMHVSSLEDIALNGTDPMHRLLALELGAFGFSRPDQRVALEIFDEISSELNEDVVARRITNQSMQRKSGIETAENNKTLQVGQKAPEFTLPDLGGDDVALNSVLDKNDIVFVDFWASWCGPCIAAFPELKELYSKYREDGFEILAVSIDSTFEDWEQATDQHEVPWVNLGQIGEDSNAVGSVSQTYGAQTIPKGYVLDKEGCIIGKDVFPDRLGEFLAAQYE